MYQNIFVIVLLFHWSHTQNSNCDFSTNVQPGVLYQISSPNYPNNYPSGSLCRWIGTCPSGYNCRLDCQITLPQSSSCSVDRFLISSSGDRSLQAADYYCGSGTVSAVSTGVEIVAGLKSQSNQGRFRCDLYAQTASAPACSCGYKKTNRIVGGQETSPYEYPMMAGIVYASAEDIKCGATIISQNYVVTAAHCVAGKQRADLKVVAGVHNRDTAQQVFDVSTIRIHPQYNSNNYDYDVAVLGLNKPIQFNEIVGPVCLPFKFRNADFTGAKTTLLGWGTLFFGGQKAPALRKVDVDVISQSSCQSRLPSVTAQQICTFTQGKDSCQDDSGGPLLYQDPDTGLVFIIGIISSGMFCASNSPAKNTRLTSVLNWIEQNAPANYCRK